MSWRARLPGRYRRTTQCRATVSGQGKIGVRRRDSQCVDAVRPLAQRPLEGLTAGLSVSSLPD